MIQEKLIFFNRSTATCKPIPRLASAIYRVSKKEAQAFLSLKIIFLLNYFTSYHNSVALECSQVRKKCISLFLRSPMLQYDRKSGYFLKTKSNWVLALDGRHNTEEILGKNRISILSLCPFLLCFPVRHACSIGPHLQVVW